MNSTSDLPQPHAFHLNLPPHFMDEDGVPTVTRFAARKAKQLVDLVFSIQLNESMFEYHSGEMNGEHENGEDDDDDDEEDEEDIVNDREAPVAFADETSGSLLMVSKRCSRLISLLSTLENLKFSGISQAVTMDIVLHLLRLVTATVTYDVGTTQKAVLHFDNVGTVLHFGEHAETAESKVPRGDLKYKVAATENELVADLAQDFALPSPCREVLLLTIINLLSNKGPLRSVSNSSIYTADEKNRSLLILQWKPLLRMLLRTAPYLDEHAMGHPVKDSNARASAILKRTVQLIRDARHFFEQGVRPPDNEVADAEKDQTSKEIWDMVRNDVLFHSHTHACYRGTILLYLFQPTRSTQDFYLSVLPHWWDAWTNIDRCPEYDFLWLALFCRARKHVKDFDWSPIRKRLLTHSQYWLQLPIGGGAMDTSFPRASNPRSRSCPPRLKVFAGTGSSYDEGIDFVAKVAKLLVAGLGTGKAVEFQDRPPVTEGTNDILLFLSFATPYFNPSNLGQWTFTLGAFLHYFAYELCCRIGAAAGNEALQQSHPAVVEALLKVQSGSHFAEIPAHEIVALMDALLPLCQQTLYSKNGHVGRAGEAAMLYLVQIDAAHSTPSFIDFAIRALDISAVNLSHQAPAALSALTRLIQPALRSDPSILLARLPELLRLSLAGIDSNDQNKTIRTLILYRSLASWVPVGGRPESWPILSARDETMIGGDGTLRLGRGLYETLSKSKKSKEYMTAWERLPPTSLLKQGILVDAIDIGMQQLLVEEAASAMSDWALEFLERVFGLLRASGEREKTAKRASGVASRHSSADVHQALNFSRVLKECMVQVFAAMDDVTHQLAVRTVAKFLEEETLPTASKDAALLCQAAAASRSGDALSPGLDELVPLLTDDLSHHSTKTVTYRLRCLAGAVRSASHGVVKHRVPISNAITFALSSDDRHLFKTGCKLLRHTLSTLVEAYPISSDARPRSGSSTSSSFCLGRSAQLHGDSVRWHVPDRESIGFSWELLESHVVQRLDSLCTNIDDDGSVARSRLLNTLEVNDLRRCLRVIRYSIRGGASVLLDSIVKPSQGEDFFIPYEKACYSVINDANEKVRDSLLAIRGRLCSFVVVLSSVIASETLYPNGLNELPESDPYRRILPLISADPKVCKETSDLSLLLLTRRGSAFRSQEARTIWKAQKQLASDFSLCAQVDHMAEFLQSASLYGDAKTILYKDGEDGGKTVPRRLLVARVQLFHDSLQRNASFEIPRRLRIVERHQKVLRNRLFSVKSSLSGMIGNLETVLVSSAQSPLDVCEGLADGLYALCCHSNAQVRASALSVIDYTMTRFGWLVAVRVPRLLSGLALKDQGMNGKFGIPSCCALVESINQQGKRKKLAEAVKGVCSILSLSRAMKHVLQNEKIRYHFAKTVCGSDNLISLLPTEEMQKFVHYLQAVFSPFRSKIYHQPRLAPADAESHTATLELVLDILSEKRVEDISDAESAMDGGAAVHWRKMLLACWFLLSLIDEGDINDKDGSITRRTWSTCFRILETEKGQPLQRVGLGLFGRLVHLGGEGGLHTQLREKMRTESFCRSFGEALVYDHKEDTSVGGGHDAQWATGVEDIIRDAARNIAPRTLFPFQRTSQALGAFKALHAQLIELVLSTLDKESATTAIRHLLNFAKEIANAPPSEDQRNQQITSAEIFGGVCGSFLRRPSGIYFFRWDDLLLAHLDDVMGKIPFSLSGAYFDAIRYALQFCPPSSFFPLTKWLVERIRSTLWQPSADSMMNAGEALSQMNANGSTHGTEGFTAQSKWLYLFTAVLIEMDESEAGSALRVVWYKKYLADDARMPGEGDIPHDPELESSWQLVIDNLLPRLTAALGHPFDSCRDHVSRCLFRICYCHRKMERMHASRAPSRANSLLDLDESMNAANDPGSVVVKTLASLEKSDNWSFIDRYNALSTARRFIAYSVHLGEAKFEYSDYVIPLLHLAFEAMKSTVEEEIKASDDDSQDENAAKRALEAEVIKGYRCTIAEVSITAVISYGKDSDMAKVLDIVEQACKHEKWQVRHAATHFLRCFQGAHKFVFSSEDSSRTMRIVAGILADKRREVSSAGMAALTGILAASPVDDVTQMVNKYIQIAGKSKMTRKKKSANAKPEKTTQEPLDEELKRAQDQKMSVYFLCAAIMAQPYETPPYVPAALAAISKHSFERNAPLGVRDTVKRCCADYKKTHMSDNWELHRSAFSQEQLEALEDVVSTPHYYA
jgi:Proteasome-substrate-size regulator, mid region/Domain of unknown function (DUF3437)